MEMIDVQGKILVEKAKLMTISDELERLEERFCKERSLMTENGLVASKLIFADLNDDDFIRECGIFDEKNAVLLRKKYDIEKRLNELEKTLVDMSLSFLEKTNPKEVSVLRHSCDRNYTIRQKVVDLAMRLDAMSL